MKLLPTIALAGIIILLAFAPKGFAPKGFGPKGIGPNGGALAGFAPKGFGPMQTEPWRVDQLLQPEELVAQMKRVDASRPLIISVGPSAVIEGSIDVGPANKKENMEKLAKLVANKRKDADIVIYCGCCPFEHCPNVRPAFKYLTEQGFTKHKLLNLTHNVREDWMRKGYPSVRQ